MSLGCKYEGNIWLSWKFLQQLAGTGFHGGRSRLDSIFQELLHAAALGSVVSRKVREPLKSEGFYYRAAIVQVVVQSCHGALAFGSREAKSRNHGRKMPAQFDLIGLGEETEEFWVVAIEEARFLGGDFFGGIGGAQAHDGIFVPEALDEFAKPLRFLDDEPHHFIRRSDRAPVRTFEHGGDFLTRHFAKKGRLNLSAGAAGLGAFAAEIGGDYFHSAAHFKEAGAHAAADSLVEGIFAGGHD